MLWNDPLTPRKFNHNRFQNPSAYKDFTDRNGLLHSADAFTHRATFTNIVAIESSVDQDQAAHNMHPDV